MALFHFSAIQLNEENHYFLFLEQVVDKQNEKDFAQSHLKLGIIWKKSAAHHDRRLSSCAITPHHANTRHIQHSRERGESTRSWDSNRNPLDCAGYFRMQD